MKTEKVTREDLRAIRVGESRTFELPDYAAVLSAKSSAYAFGRMGYGPGTVLYSLSRLFFVPPLLFFPWVFAYISRFENSVTGTLKFTGWLTLRYFGRSVLLAAELAGFLLISWLLPQIFPLLPAAVCLLMSLTIEPVFRLFQPETDNASVDAWYNE